MAELYAPRFKCPCCKEWRHDKLSLKYHLRHAHGKENYRIEGEGEQTYLVDAMKDRWSIYVLR